MSDALRRLRQEQHQRYLQLSNEEKPRVEPCKFCLEDPYVHEICPMSGQFHNREKKKLIGGRLIEEDTTSITSSELMDAINRTRVKWVPSRTQLVKADATALNVFQSFVTQMEWKMQRYGILYGRKIPQSAEAGEGGAVVEVHAIYEPEQVGSACTFRPAPDAHIRRVAIIAEGLGLCPVGAICTHPPRDPDQIILDARELLLCAHEQSRHGDECVLLTVSPNMAEGGVVECQAWQASPQCVYYYRLGLLHEPEVEGDAPPCLESGRAPNSVFADPAQAKLVHTSIDLQVAQENTDAKGKQQLVVKEPSRAIDTRWFTSYTAVTQFESNVVSNLFIRLKRPGMVPPTMPNLRNYFLDPKRKSKTFAEKIADFHVLVFLVESVFSTDEDARALAEIAKNKTMTAEAMNYEAIVSEYFQNA